MSKAMWATGLVGVCIAVLAFRAGPVEQQPLAKLANERPVPADSGSRKSADRLLDGQANAEDPARRNQDVTPETETVFGIDVRKDRNCTVKQHYIAEVDGTLTRAYSCVTEGPQVSHPYERYSSDALASLAYGDAKAAEVLGKRLIEADPEVARKLLLRASALSGGDPQPIVWLASQSYSTTSVNGIPQTNSMKERYVLTSLAERLGANYADSDYWQRQLQSQNIDRPGIEKLDQRANQTLRTMIQIERAVTGESTIRAGTGD